MPKARAWIEGFRRNDFFFHGSVLFAGLAVANIFNYLYYMLAGRVLGVNAYGEMTSLTSALMAVAAPASVAQLVIARLTADLEATGNRQALARLSSSVLRTTAIIALLVFLASFAFRDALSLFFHSSTAPVLTAAATLGAYAVALVQRGILQGSHRFGHFSVSCIVESVGRLGIGIPLAIGHGAFGALLGASIGALGSLVYNLWALRSPRRDDDSKPGVAFDFNRVVRTTSGIGVSQLALTALLYYDVALARHAFDARSAGLYAAAALVGRAIIGILQFVPTVIMPKATARAAAGASTLPLLASGIGLSAAIAGVGIVAAVLAPGQLAAVFAGPAFREAAPIVLPYVLAASALGIANVVTAYQIGLHRYAFVVPSTIVAAVEISLNAFWHPSLAHYVTVLLGGHALFLVAVFFGISFGVRRQPSMQRGEPQPSA
jgi:O-antigen/teichoic acid export membrane protein